MIRLTGEKLALELREDGTGIAVFDLHRNEKWLLDEETRLVSAEAPRHSQDPWSYTSLQKAESKVYPLGKGKAEREAENAVRATYDTPAGRFVVRWVMEPDRLRIIVDPSECDGVNGFSMPGTFIPQSGGFQSAIPNCQGILHTGKGPAFYNPRWGQATMGFSLSMFGQIAGNGALLSIIETDKDATLHWEKTEQSDIRVMWRQEPSMGGISYAREVVLMPTDPDLTVLCKAYRRYEIEKGRFRTWEEKLVERPELDYLFGACLIFVGYWDDTELDYEDSFRGLRAMGIDKALVYPLYHNTTQDTRSAIEGNWIDQRRLIPLMKELGYLPGGFIYLTDGPEGEGEDKWRDLRLDESGQPHLYWEMNGLKWYSLSNEERFDWAKRYLDNEMKDLKWLHYDVVTAPPFFEDYSPAHPADARSDAEWRIKMLDYTAGKGWIVSSEGFWGRAASQYDLGNTKFTNPIGGDEYAVVPMTMLVYHDSAFHTWWEIDNYNNTEHRAQYERGYWDRYPFIGGQPSIQSAMDALMGTPPDIFPFGRMWNLIPHSRDLYFYNKRLEDSSIGDSIGSANKVADSVACAKRVMDLNARTGKVEMTGFKLHTPDGAVQETQFADGTRVIANFANVPLDIPGVGLLGAESWISVKE